MAGATGGGCECLRAALDLAEHVDHAEGWGDGDGAVDALDCDNHDEDVVPVLPDRDGYRTVDCLQLDEGCYICPPGSVGDDDSAEAGPVQDQAVEGAHQDGCGDEGCGMSFGGSALLPFVFTIGRRRSAR